MNEEKIVRLVHNIDVFAVGIDSDVFDGEEVRHESEDFAPPILGYACG